AEARLPPVRVLRFHLLDDRRGMGLPRRARDRAAVRHIRLAWLSHRAPWAGAVRAAPRDRHQRDDRSERGTPYRRQSRRDSGNGGDAAVHVVWALFTNCGVGGDRSVGERGTGEEDILMRIADFGLR